VSTPKLIILFYYVIFSKEDDLDKLQNELMTLSAELEKRNDLVTEMKESHELQSLESQEMLLNLQNTIKSLSKDLEDKVGLCLFNFA